MSPRRNWDSPNPSLASECAPPPTTGGWGHTRQGVRGWGSPNTDVLRKSLALCLLCGHTVQRSLYLLYRYFLWQKYVSRTYDSAMKNIQ
jgi:hypothetical protein